jgi:pSer/pThr/pTyr-binding forkhead associated (FHA) protein
VGRHPDCDIVLNDPNVSRRHAEIRPAGQGFAISDLQSTNGTRVNSLVVGIDHPLASGDVITIGAARIRFEAS